MIFSILIPTLNAARTLDECLAHVRAQNFPISNYEIIIADGGSTDQTRQIAAKYQASIVENPLKTGEAGKMVALKHAKGEYVVFLDSDNILIDPDWLQKMQQPFADQDIVATEPIRYDCRPTDNAMTRYFAYMGMGDPLNYFLGNYDRLCAINNQWTNIPLPQTASPGFLKVQLDPTKPMPTIGANGFVLRRQLLTTLQSKDYLFDVDVLHSLSQNQPFHIAKTHTGVVHLFAPNLSTFIRKQQRRVRDYVYYNSQKARQHSDEDQRNFFLKLLYPGGTNFSGLLFFVLSCVTVIPLVIQMLRGYLRKPDWVWLLHPLLCEITVYVYGTERIRSIFKKQLYDRTKWKQ